MIFFRHAVCVTVMIYIGYPVILSEARSFLGLDPSTTLDKMREYLAPYNLSIFWLERSLYILGYTINDISDVDKTLQVLRDYRIRFNVNIRKLRVRPWVNFHTIDHQVQQIEGAEPVVMSYP